MWITVEQPTATKEFTVDGIVYKRPNRTNNGHRNPGPEMIRPMFEVITDHADDRCCVDPGTGEIVFFSTPQRANADVFKSVKKQYKEYFNLEWDPTLTF